MRNLHPGANLHSGCNFGHVNGVPTLVVVQIYLHPGANCAHARKMFNLLYILIGDFDFGRHFILQLCIKPI